MLRVDDFLVYNDSLHLRGVSRQCMSYPNEHFDETKAPEESYDSTMQGYPHQSSTNNSSSNPSQQYTGAGGMQGQANWGHPQGAASIQQIQPQPSFSDLMRELSHEQSVALHEAARLVPPNSRSGTPLQPSFSSSPAAMRLPLGGRMPSSSNLPESHTRSSSSSGSTGWQQMQQPAPDEASFEMFPCEYCQASFSRRHDLERHRRGHSGETPYVCEGCGAGFVRVDGRGRHWKLQPQCEKLHFQRGGGGKRRTAKSDSADGEGGSAQRAS